MRENDIRKNDIRKNDSQRGSDSPFSVVYMTFLIIASMITVYVSIVYLQLHFQSTALHRQVISQQTVLATITRENDVDYEKTMASLDLDKLRNIAVNNLGMVYPSENQIETYEVKSSDYVRQYTEIHKEQNIN